tara:strand:+ start:21395 stop:22450 length:1056 start_codon:yes stop_codon:yes gene_type:complete
MFQQLNNFLKRIFPNEETIAVTLLIIFTVFLLFLLEGILTPFLISIVFAYLLVGVQLRLERIGISSGFALTITFGIFLSLGVALLLWLIPLLYAQTNEILKEIPVMFDAFKVTISTMSNQLPGSSVSQEIISGAIDIIKKTVESSSQVFIAYGVGGIQTVFSVALTLIMLPILVFFLLFDRQSVINSFISILPKERSMLNAVWQEMDGQLSNYVRGKSLEILIVGGVAAIIFMVFGLKYTAVLAALVGFSVLIPFLGAILVTIPVMFVGFVQFGFSFELLLLFGSYTILQMLDGYLLVPILFSDAVKLHPFMIILAVFVFGGLFGFWGVFFAIPIATFIKALWNSWPSSSS